MKKILPFFVLITFYTFCSAQELENIPLDTNPCNPVGIAVKDNILYIGEVCDQEVTKVDLTQGNPKSIQVFLSDVEFAGTLLFIEEELYIAHFNSNTGIISKINVSDNSNTLTTVATGLGRQIKGMALNGNDLYIGERGSSPDFNGSILKIDISEPNPNHQVFFDNIEDSVNDIIFYGNNLYIAHGDKISKIDITQPNPELVTIFDNTPSPVSMVTFNNMMLISFTGTENKISSFNLLDQNPVITDFITDGLEDPWNLYIDNQTLYISQQTAGLISKVNIEALNDNEFTIKNRLKIITNRADEGIIQFENLEDIKLNEFKIFNSLGQETQIKKINQSNLKGEIITKRLNNGLYFLCIKLANNAVETYKFFVN